MATPFASSKRKLARAKEHLANFEREVVIFCASDQHTPLKEPDPENAQHEVHKIKFREFPDALLTAADECIHHLRTCLDNSIYDCAATKLPPKWGEAVFPFSDSATTFESGLNGRCKGVPLEIRSLLRAFKPYKGGDDFLCALNALSNTDKHALLGVKMNSLLGNAHGTGVVQLFMEPVWDSVKHEIEIGTFRNDPNVECHIELFFTIAFDKVDVISGEPAPAVLGYGVTKVESILMAIEGESRRIGLIG